MPLSGFNSRCDLHQKIIISRDPGNRQEHIANNVDASKVYQYKIDGDVIKDGKRCDYLLWNDDKKQLYLIELKGSDLEYALNQLEQTEEYLREHFSDEVRDDMFYYRVVLNRIKTQATMSIRVKKFKRNHFGKLQYKTKRLEESI